MRWLIDERLSPGNMAITAEEVLKEIGPVQEVLDAHDGVVTVIDTADGNVMLSLDGGCVGCSSTPMTAMQIYYSLKQLDAVSDVVFVNGELPEYMRTFIDQKMADESKGQNVSFGANPHTIGKSDGEE